MPSIRIASLGPFVTAKRNIDSFSQKKKIIQTLLCRNSDEDDSPAVVGKDGFSFHFNEKEDQRTNKGLDFSLIQGDLQ